MTYSIVAAIQRATIREHRLLQRWLQENLSCNPRFGIVNLE